MLLFRILSFWTYTLVDWDEVFADDAGHLTHKLWVALIWDLLDECGEEFGLDKEREGVSFYDFYSVALDWFLDESQIAAQF